MDPVTRAADGDQAARLTLLIADDDPVVRSMLSMALEQRFTIVGVAQDGDGAVASAQAHRPDAAVVDIDMPRGGGPRAVRGIAEVSPQTAIVVLSGDETDAVVRDVLQAGAMSYCRKGVASHELADILERSVAAQRQQASAGSGLTFAG